MKIRLQKKQTREHTMSVRVSLDTWTKLCDLAQRNGTTASNLVRLIVEETIAKGVEIV